MQLVLPVKEGKRPLSFRPAKLAFHRMGRRFWQSAKTLRKFTLAANVPQNAYIDTSLPRWS